MTAPDFAALVAERLAPFRRTHFYCEDSWYSCPLAEDGCADDRLHGCNCGADKVNVALDKLAQDIGRGIAAALDRAHACAEMPSEYRDAAAVRAFAEASRG